MLGNPVATEIAYNILTTIETTGNSISFYYPTEFVFKGKYEIKFYSHMRVNC